MAITFKSSSTADLTMLDANARQVLQILGKDASGKGILTKDQLPGAISALEAAVAQEGNQKTDAADGADKDDDEDKGARGVTLRQRAHPLLDLLKRSHADGKDVTWGV